MTDIVERLRPENGLSGHYDPPVIQMQAADEIERLREIVSRAIECIDADDVIGAYENLTKAEEPQDE